MGTEESPTEVIHELIDILHDLVDEYEEALANLTRGNCQDTDPRH